MEGYYSNCLESGVPQTGQCTFAFVEAIRLNHQSSSKVSGVLAKLLRTRLDGDEMFECCKDFHRERNLLASVIP